MRVPRARPRSATEVTLAGTTAPRPCSWTQPCWSNPAAIDVVHRSVSGLVGTGQADARRAGEASALQRLWLRHNAHLSRRTPTESGHCRPQGNRRSRWRSTPAIARWRPWDPAELERPRIGPHAQVGEWESAASGSAVTRSSRGTVLPGRWWCHVSSVAAQVLRSSPSVGGSITSRACPQSAKSSPRR